jgi:hypothetical protein
MVPSHRRALRARLLFIRHIDGLVLDEEFLQATFGCRSGQSHGRGDPANPAALVLERLRLDEN